MPRNGQSALAIPVPEADGLLRAVAARFPEAVRPVPAHVSVLYPFLPADSLDDAVTGALAELFAARRELPVEFGDVLRRDGFLALRPDPARELAELTGAVCRRWPRLVPYEGRFGAVEPHLTVALNTTAERADAVERQILPGRLPVASVLREAWLLVFDGGWTLRRRFTFAGD